MDESGWGTRKSPHFSLEWQNAVFKACYKIFVMTNKNINYGNTSIYILLHSEAVPTACESFQMKSKSRGNCWQSMMMLAGYKRAQLIFKPIKQGHLTVDRDLLTAFIAL